MPPIQTERPIAVSSPLGEDVLLFHTMTATERLSGLFEFRLELKSSDETLKFEDLLGQSMTVRVELPDDKQRFFNGYVSRFSQAGSEGDYAKYQAVLRPWLWFLTRTADCRIFQEKTAPEIIKAIFEDHDFAEFQDKLSATYRKWVYCVQYRETDFNFVSRLMEQEGIYYYFKHEDGKHTMVLSDAYGAHQAIPGYEKVPYFPPTQNVVRDHDHIFEFATAQEIQPGMYALTDFNFETPKANLAVKASASRKHDKAKLEVYDYPGEYPIAGDGEKYVKARLEEFQAQYETVQGTGTARGLFPGGLFKLAGHPRDDQNREYLVVSTSHDLKTIEYATGSGGGGANYAGRFTAIDSKQPYRQPRVTPKPFVQGPQTAIVVGPAGEEIFTDEYGRVKVQFHWDREGQRDENSSCWVRVAQVWAGKKWGGIQIPRIGQEVVVDFLEGDPDQPIITGRVYNADAMPPYALPGNKTQSGVKSRSSKGGNEDNFNEFRFEDKKGSEEVYLHAEKDYNQVTEHDRTEQVGHDRSLTVGNDKDETVQANKSITVGANHAERVGSNMTVVVGANLTETVAINYAETVGAAMELTIGGLFTETVGAAKVETIGAKKAETVARDRSLSVGGDLSESVSGGSTLTVSKDRSLSVGGNLNVSISKNRSESVDGTSKMAVAKEFSAKAKAINIEAEDQIVIKTGQASITMKKSGDVTIKGGKITIKGSGDVVVKGAKIAEN